MLTLADTLAQTPNTAISGSAILALLAALGLSSTAGLRAYLPLLAVALGSTITGPNGQDFIPLQSNFKDLGTGPLIVVLILLVIGEFIIDKVPIVDHVSDAVHTIIRPLSGAIIMAGTANTVSDVNPWIAAAIGGILALGVHGVKATTRPAVSATTAGIGNPVVSVIEDVIAVVAIVLLVALPIVGFALVVLLALLLGRLLFGIVQRFRRKRRGVQVIASRRRSRGKGIGAAAIVGGGAVPAIGAALSPPGTPALPMPRAQTTPTTPTRPTAPTVAATQQAPYAPITSAPAPANPIMPPPPTTNGPTPTQTYNRGQPVKSSPDDTTLPGSY